MGIFVYLLFCMPAFTHVQVGDLQQGASVSRHQLPDLRSGHMWRQRRRRHGPDRLSVSRPARCSFVRLCIFVLVGLH